MVVRSSAEETKPVEAPVDATVFYGGSTFSSEEEVSTLLFFVVSIAIKTFSLPRFVASSPANTSHIPFLVTPISVALLPSPN